MNCLNTNVSGAGGVAGGGGTSNITLSNIGGASSNGIPVIRLVAGIGKTVKVVLHEDVLGSSIVDMSGVTTAEFIVKDYLDSGITSWEEEGTTPEADNGVRTFTITNDQNDTVIRSMADLGITERIMFDIVNDKGEDLTTDVRLARQWVDDDYIMKWYGGWPVGTYTIYPHGGYRIQSGTTINVANKPNLRITATPTGEPGEVSITFPAIEIRKPGLWPAAIVTYENGIRTNEFFCYFEVLPGMNDGALDGANEPLTAGEVRMALMDYSPDYNTLLNDLEFSDVQIYAAMRRPIREWNETPPDLGKYNLRNFPFHEAWLKATCAYLLDSAAYRYNRNTLPHNAGGLSMDPMNKGTIYRQDAMILKQEWKAFIMSKKTELNMNACWGTTSIASMGSGWVNEWDY